MLGSTVLAVRPSAYLAFANSCPVQIRLKVSNTGMLTKRFVANAIHHHCSAKVLPWPYGTPTSSLSPLSAH